MPKKEPLYFKKSKAREQSELDYFYHDSESFLKRFIGNNDLEVEPVRPKRTKPQKTKKHHSYKKKYDYPYYEDQRIEKRGLNDEDHYLNSDYSVYVRDFDYWTEDSVESSEDESDFETHKTNKVRKAKQSGNNYYDQLNKRKVRHNSKKQRSSRPSYDRSTIMGDRKDFEIYISQTPITLKYESVDSPKDPVISVTHNKPLSKKQKGSKVCKVEKTPQKNNEISLKKTNMKNNQPVKEFCPQQQRASLQIYSTLTDPKNKITNLDIKELPTNDPNHLAQSTLHLVYLPVIVMGSNNVSQHTETIEPTLLTNSGNKLPPNIIIDSQNFMTFFTTHNPDQSNVFEQTNKNVNNTEFSLCNKNLTTNESTGKNVSVKDTKLKELQNKLCESSMGSAMSKERYASLIASQTERNPSTLSAIIKICKTLKKTKHVTAQNVLEQPEDRNENYKTNSTVTPVINTPNIDNYCITPSNSIARLTQQSIVNKNNDMDVCHEKKLSEEVKILQDTNSDVFEHDEKEKNISNNINEKSVMSNIFKIDPHSMENTQSEETVRDKLSQIRNEQMKMTETKSNNFKDNQQNSKGFNKGASQDQINESKKTSFITTKYSIISPDPTIIGDNKNVEDTLSDVNLHSLDSPTENKSFQTTQSRNIDKNILELKHDFSNRNTTTSSIFMTKSLSQTEDGKKRYRPKTIDTEIIFVSHDAGFMGEFSENRFKDTPGDKELTNNPKGILKKEHLRNTTDDGEASSGIIQYNKPNQEECIKKTKQESNILTQTTLYTEQEPNKCLKNNTSDTKQGVEKIPQPPAEELPEQINKHIDCDEMGKKLSEDSLAEKPAIDTIYISPEKSSNLQRANTSAILFSEIKRNSRALNHQPLKVPEYTSEIVIIFFQIAQYILGVSCFDKLADVIDFFYFEDND